MHTYLPTHVKKRKKEKKNVHKYTNSTAPVYDLVGGSLELHGPLGVDDYGGLVEVDGQKDEVPHGGVDGEIEDENGPQAEGNTRKSKRQAQLEHVARQVRQQQKAVGALEQPVVRRQNRSKLVRPTHDKRQRKKWKRKWKKKMEKMEKKKKKKKKKKKEKKKKKKKKLAECVLFLHDTIS